MKRQGTLVNYGCFGTPKVEFPEGDKLGLRFVPKGFKNGDKVEITLVEEKGSAQYNMEHVVE